GIGMDEIMEINRFAISDVFPDLTLLFDIEPELGLARIEKNKHREKNRLDLEEINFHKKIYEGYQLLINQNPKRIKQIDTKKTNIKKINLHKKVYEGYQLHLNQETKRKKKNDANKKINEVAQEAIEKILIKLNN